jgi:ABC-type molybdenum transport system ATPase subunit/photorepair protein PhrA
VRSFDSRESETIEFGKPLTLIVGPNGTGKTVRLLSLFVTAHPETNNNRLSLSV